MPAYRNEARANIGKGKTYAEEVEDTAKHQEEEGEEATPGDTWEQRYANLRRHEQNLRREFEQKLAEKDRQLSEATKKQIRFPKTEEEIEEWKKKYPDVAGIVETIARKVAADTIGTKEDAFKEVENIRKELTAAQAMTKLLELHPDFKSVAGTPEFKEWAETQPPFIYDALYKNNTDYMAAARAMALYKLETGAGKKRKGAAKTTEDAAAAIPRSGSSASPKAGKDMKYSESLIQRMIRTDRTWYSKNKDAIQKAIKDGEFVYDLSGR